MVTITSTSAGWRRRERGEPRLGIAVAGGAGVVFAIGAISLASEHAPDSGRAWGSAAITAALVVLAYAVWSFVPPIARAALVATIAIGIPATVVFVFALHPHRFADLRPAFAVSAAGLALAYAVGFARARVLLLALALTITWSWLTLEAARPEVPLVPFGISSSYSAMGGTDSFGSLDCNPDNLDSPACNQPLTPTEPRAPRPGPLAAVSLAFGALYFAALYALDRRGQRGTATALPVPGALAVVVGLSALAATWHVYWLIALITMASGVAVGFTGLVRQRRFTIWFGALLATVGTVILAGDLTDRSVGLDTANSSTRIGVALMLFGIAAAAGGIALARLLGEPRSDAPDLSP
jgi:hypothetical protein